MEFKVLRVLHGLDAVFKSREITQAHLNRLGEVQMAMAVMGRDFEQIIKRPITNEIYKREPAFVETTEHGQQHIVFTRAGYVNPKAQFQRSTLQRVGYRFEDGKLIRENWQMLDRAKPEKPDTRVLLTNLKSVHWLT